MLLKERLKVWNRKRGFWNCYW